VATYVQNVDVETPQGQKVFNLAIVVEAPNAAAAAAAAIQSLAVTQPELRIVKFGTAAQVTTS
jgi:hypothetical protein